MEITPERLQRVADAIEDPCDEGGYDPFCRNSRGELCRFHAEHFRPPDYPCLKLLRLDLARRFIEEVDARRRLPDDAQRRALVDARHAR